MTLAAQYAKALYESNAPEGARLKNLRETLRRRGHEKLLQQIYTEYKRLVEEEKRLQEYKKITPEKEQTRILLELYQKLVHTPSL
ncbi:hypothetical protein A3F55_01660 [Candidatus Adlerbacteria bacterium RIFCSPHIGHO2_12_FULL_53_18]|uniref:ATP synthase F(1) sector subunit delta n=1 Tax=Candidatus Adlerbacteria bacterium RIFCSPHIGHO2_12_FULL_53_18 TaxID=1797242 RepID=A0A1F4XRM7_9BACT|nr:MAG: hypothetical protein A3F55_01660 [Candidatus Adlerbacteria bacterium RIFCSPHIGHO2_12_FULL_53_18]